eukprot:TRINITY_DN1908_c0_g1_i5.p1 TRINITY_DN1908_c0_g1~~TRINITY_DN1908_c0_g1_i5.p1  ORF type:complete len:102 (-),score=13.04 TRINITY_DN1908_c0_g1_i5:597-902(-)
MIRRPPRSPLSSSSAASDVYKRQVSTQSTGGRCWRRMGNTCSCSESEKPRPKPKREMSQRVELGDIEYTNIDGKHGVLDSVLAEAASEGKPIFANFVEWPG